MPKDANTEITIKGIPALTRWLRWEPQKADRAIKRASTNAGFFIQREARRNAPFRRGDLERGITFEVIDGGVKIFVPINHAAGKYAYKMHYGKYNRGQGTVDKGSRAGRNYITRVITGEATRINSFFKDAVDRIGD